MDIKRVLIFPAGTEIAFEILNSLKYSKYIEVFGVNSMPCHGEFVFKNYIQVVLPFVRDNGFIDAFNSVIDHYHIDYVYPAHDEAGIVLTQNAERVHATIVTSPLKTVTICRSKIKTYDYFRDTFFVPRYYLSPNDVKQFPVFIKPDIGQGAFGAKKINNKEDLQRELDQERKFVICEYLPGEEFTVDCFTDQNGALRVCELRSRERIKNGIAVRSTLLPMDNHVKIIADYINEKLVFTGAWFFQLKKNQFDQYKLLEVAPRIPGTMGVSRALGINFPLLTLHIIWGDDINIINNQINVTLDRAYISRYHTNVEYDRVYIDFDDTFYLREEININVIAFCYQCVNKKIPIILLTKHEGSILDSLCKYKITPLLFDKILVVDQNDEKSNYIEGDKPIFIDDSFSERWKVKEKLSIPVYDLDLIDTLLDWRM